MSAVIRIAAVVIVIRSAEAVVPFALLLRILPLLRMLRGTFRMLDNGAMLGEVHIPERCSAAVNRLLRNGSGFLLTVLAEFRMQNGCSGARSSFLLLRLFRLLLRCRTLLRLRLFGGGSGLLLSGRLLRMRLARLKQLRLKRRLRRLLRADCSATWIPACSAVLARMHAR